jgi:hypothetical protein
LLQRHETSKLGQRTAQALFYNVTLVAL